MKEHFFRITRIQTNELTAALLSFAYFFCVLSAYYVLRPLREEMGLAGGVDNLPWLFMGTLSATLLLVPFVGYLVSRYSRTRFISYSYRFFAFNLLIFYGLMWFSSDQLNVYLGRVFYIWLSAFNMFVVSVFWSFMADGFGYRRSKRLFAFIAAGGTIGAITGSGLTAFLVEIVGRLHLMLCSVVLLELAVQLVRALDKQFNKLDKEEPQLQVEAVGERNLWQQLTDGVRLAISSPFMLGISLYLLLYPFLTTFLYFEQAHIINDAVQSREERAAIFAQIDLWVNVLTLVLQLFVTGRLMQIFSVGVMLMILPTLTVLGFISLANAPILMVLVIFQIIRRAGSYAITRPVRETLFTLLDRDHKYKAKNFIDTFVYRTGDALSAGLNGILASLSFTVSAVAWVAVPFAGLWVATAYWLGLKQKQLYDSRKHEAEIHQGVEQ